MRDYELTFVVRPDIEDNQVKATAQRVQELVTQRSGEMTNVQQWGKRRLAYQIDHHSEGVYFVYRYRLEPRLVGEVEHELNLSEQVLRFITVELEPKELEALKNPPPPMAARPERRPREEGAEEPAAAGTAVSAAEPTPAGRAEAAEGAAQGGGPVAGGTAVPEAAATAATEAPEAETVSAAEQPETEETAAPAGRKPRGRAAAAEATEAGASAPGEAEAPAPTEPQS